jgi:hypothetical protein
LGRLPSREKLLGLEQLAAIVEADAVMAAAGGWCFEHDTTEALVVGLD